MRTAVINYMGSNVRLILRGASLKEPDLSSARLQQALMAAIPACQPNAITRPNPTIMIARFRRRLSPHQACLAAKAAVARAGLDVETCIWSGPPGTATYGDSIASSREGLELIASGQKTTLVISLADCMFDGEQVAAVGDLVTMLDHTGTPALRYVVTQSRILPFDEVPIRFEGMTDPKAIEKWWLDYQPYFAGIGAFDPRMPLVCERIRLDGVLAPDLLQRTKYVPKDTDRQPR